MVDGGRRGFSAWFVEDKRNNLHGTSKPIPYKCISSKEYCERNSHDRSRPTLVTTLPSNHPAELKALF